MDEKDPQSRQISKGVTTVALASLVASVGMAMPAEAAINEVEGKIATLRGASADDVQGQILSVVASQVSDVEIADYTESYTQTYTQTYNQTYNQRINPV